MIRFRLSSLLPAARWTILVTMAIGSGALAQSNKEVAFREGARSGMALSVTAEQPITVNVPIPTPQEKLGLERAILHVGINQAVLPTKHPLQVRLFVGDKTAGPTTPPSDPHYAGTFTLLPFEFSKEGPIIEPQKYAFDITKFLTAVGANQSTAPVTFVVLPDQSEKPAVPAIVLSDVHIVSK